MKLRTIIFTAFTMLALASSSEAAKKVGKKSKADVAACRKACDDPSCHSRANGSSCYAPIMRCRNKCG